MTRPTSLHIMSQHWSVSYHEGDTPLIFGTEVENKVGESAMGYTNSGLQQITVRREPEVSFHQERDTLLHECMHAIFSQTGLDQALSEADAEDYICRLTPVILTLLRDNPEFTKYLIHPEPSDNHVAVEFTDGLDRPSGVHYCLTCSKPLQVAQPEGA